MAACDPCPSCPPINVSVQMASSCPKPCSRMSSKASCRNGGGDQACNSNSASKSGSQQQMPNYMKPLSRTPSYSERMNISGGPCPCHPRPDCCRVPCPQPCMPRCPVGIYAERVQSMKPDRKYEPPETKFDGLSTYKEHYFLKCGEKAKSFKPAAQFVPSDAKLDGLSTYREAYYCKCVPREKPSWSYKGTFDPSCAKMEGVSQYRFDYKGCMVPRPPSFKPASTFVPSDAKLEGVSTYRVSYIPYCPREYDYARPKQSMRPVGSPSCAPMDGASTYRMDYYPKCIPRINSFKPNIKPRFSDAKMAGVTTYKNDFIPFHFEKCLPCPCIPAEIYDQCYPNPCLFGCSGDNDKADAQSECNDPCPPPAMCNGPPCGKPDPCCQTFPYTAGNAGQQTQPCCDQCLSDPPPEKDNDEC